MTLESRKPDRRTEVDDLMMEIEALLQERERLAAEIAYWSRVLRHGSHVADHPRGHDVATRLDRIAGRLLRQGGAA